MACIFFKKNLICSPSFFQGPPGDDEAALEFFGDRFSALNPNAGERSIYVHPTCATDTENIKVR